METLEEKIRNEIEALKVPCQNDCGFFRRLICLVECDKLTAYNKKEKELYRQLQDCWYQQSYKEKRKKT